MNTLPATREEAATLLAEAYAAGLEKRADALEQAAGWLQGRLGASPGTAQSLVHAGLGGLIGGAGGLAYGAMDRRKRNPLAAATTGALLGAGAGAALPHVPALAEMAAGDPHRGEAASEALTGTEGRPAFSRFLSSLFGGNIDPSLYQGAERARAEALNSPLEQSRALARDGIAGPGGLGQSVGNVSRIAGNLAQGAVGRPAFGGAVAGTGLGMADELRRGGDRSLAEAWQKAYTPPSGGPGLDKYGKPKPLAPVEEMHKAFQSPVEHGGRSTPWGGSYVRQAPPTGRAGRLGDAIARGWTRHFPGATRSAQGALLHEALRADNAGRPFPRSVGALVGEADRTPHLGRGAVRGAGMGLAGGLIADQAYRHLLRPGFRRLSEALGEPAGSPYASPPRTGY